MSATDDTIEEGFEADLRAVDPDADPKQAGPYVLLHRVGEGGMGVVYRAHDPRLDRDVAVKVLRTASRGRRDGDAAARLVREARALARFTHPNVVEVYDVGRIGARVFVAMEFVDGVTLGRWLKSQPSVQEILGRFCAAGRGLLAAHEAGLVHRDFKPDNVLVGEDGRVRVTDFGLARSAHPEAGSQSRSRAGSQSGPPSGSRSGSRSGSGIEPATLDVGRTALTGAGLAMGTPRFMAPEQHYGEPTDARTDQYAFCVALLEALIGGRAFPGRTPADLARDKHAASFADPEAIAALPPRLRRALLKGLSPQLEDRWPSLAPLLDVLAPSPRRRLVYAGGLAATLAVAGGMAWSLASGRSPCATDAERIDAVWNPDRATAVRAAIVDSAVGYADEVAPRVRARLDAYADGWRAAQRTVCQARLADGIDPVEPDDPTDVGDARTRCLARRLAELDAVVGLLEHADAPLVEQAVPIVVSLAPATACTDPNVRTIQPPDPAALAAWLELGERTKTIEGRLRSGRTADALTDAEAMLVQARRYDWPPLHAQALLAVGDAYVTNDRIEDGVDALAESYLVATEEGLDLTAAQAAAELVFVYATHRLDRAEAERWARHARSAAERVDSRDLFARIETGLGGLYQATGDLRRSAGHFERARRLYAEEYGEQAHQVAMMLSNVGSVHQALGDYELALSEHQRALTILEEGLGPRHPILATTRENLAATLSRLGRLEDAIAEQRRVVEIISETIGPRSIAHAHALTNLGALAAAAARYDEAIVFHQRAQQIHVDTLAADHPQRIANEINLGMALIPMARHDEAIALADGALAGLPEAHPYAVYAWLLRASANLHAGDAVPAAEDAGRAEALCDRGVAVEPSVCAEVSGVLARALWEVDPTRRPQARAMVLAAEAELARTQATSALARRELADWLAAH